MELVDSVDDLRSSSSIRGISMPNFEVLDARIASASKWDGILLSMTKIPPDDILEGLYKLRIRESEKLRTVLELYDLEIHQKKLGPDYHRLKSLVKRSIEQDIRNKNFGIRNGNYENNAVVKNPGNKTVVQRILGDCWQWETNGAVCKRRHLQFPPRYE